MACSYCALRAFAVVLVKAEDSHEHVPPVAARLPSAWRLQRLFDRLPARPGQIISGEGTFQGQIGGLCWLEIEGYGTELPWVTEFVSQRCSWETLHRGRPLARGPAGELCLASPCINLFPRLPLLRCCGKTAPPFGNARAPVPADRVSIIRA